MDHNDAGGHYGPSGGSSTNDGGYGGSDNRRRKRSFDDNDNSNGYDGFKRSRYNDDRGGSYRPRNNDGGYRRGGDDDRRGGGGGRYDRSRNNDRYGSGSAHESDRARSWRLAKKAIVELGETATLGDELQGAELRDHLVSVTEKLVAEIEVDPEVKLTHLAELILRCASRLSSKTSLYAVLVGLVHEKKPAFGREIVDRAMAQLQKDVDFFSAESSAEQREYPEDKDVGARQKLANAALRLRLVVRFLGELVSTQVVKCDDVLRVLDVLQSVCTPSDFSAESDEPLRARENAAAFKDFFASIVLETMLHCGKSLVVDAEDLYESLFSRCKEYISRREEESNPRGNERDPATSWLVRRLRLDLLWDPENEEEQSLFCKKCDPLSLQWEALNLVRVEEPTVSADSNGVQESPRLRWKVPGVLYPQELFTFNAVEAEAITTPLSIDATNFDSTKIPSYDVMCRILSEDSGAAGGAIANLHLASYLLVRSNLTNALEAFYPKPALAAKHILGMCRSLNARFAETSTASAVKSEYILLETLFAAALSERSSAKITYFGAVLYHLAKTDARMMSPAVAIVVELLFREVQDMNAAAVDAFVQVFSHFLSNFEYKWPWAHWVHVLEAQEDDAQRLFVSAVIERCVRLSYLQHMQTVLPSEFHMLLPPAAKPRVRFQTTEDLNDDADVSAAAKNFYQSVTAKLKTHPTASTLQAWLEEELQTLSIDHAEALEVVWTALLDAGAATFTHMRLLLEKYGNSETIFGGEDNELILIKTVGQVWLNSPQHIGLILDMMLHQGIIHASTVAKWLVTPDAVQQYSWPYVWGIVADSVSFLQDTIATKSQQLSKGSSVLAASEDHVMTDVAALEDSLKKSQDELKKMLVLIFEGLNRVIVEHKSNCDAEGVAYKDNWFLSVLARMKSIGSKFRVALEDVVDELEASTFHTNTADHDAKKVFEYLRDSYRSS